jgi:hypothetical protein
MRVSANGPRGHAREKRKLLLGRTGIKALEFGTLWDVFVQ